MQGYAATATDLERVRLAQEASPAPQRPESRRRWILNAFDVSSAAHSKAQVTYFSM